MKFFKKNLLDILCWLLLVAGVFAIYVITIENDFTSSVERGRYALTRAIVEDHSLKIDNYKDFSFPDVSFKNGHYYSRFPGGMSFLMAPAHMVALKLSPQSPQIFGFEFVSFLSALSIGFLYILGRVNKFSISTSLLGSYVFAFGTIVFTFSGGYWAHIPSVFLVSFILVLFSLFIKSKKSWHIFAISLLYSIAFSIDFPNALFLLPILLYIVFAGFKKGKMALLKYSIVVAIPILAIVSLILLYNTMSFGKPLAIGQSASVSVGTRFKKTFIPLKDWTSEGVFDDRRLFPGLYTQVISSQRGLLMFSPIIFLSCFGFISLFKKNKFFGATLASIFLINLVFYSVWQDYWGGWSYGPRYLLAVLPIFLLPTLFFIKEKLKNIWFLILFIIAAFWGILINTLGALAGMLLPCPCEGYEGIRYSPLLAFNNLYNQNEINSFFYNAFLRSLISPQYVFLILFSVLMIFFVVLLLVHEKK
jgi:hypothetical protein